MPAKHVKAYVKRADAAAIWEAVRCPTMRFVRIKSAEQQGQLMLHRARDLLMRQCTQLINALRAHLTEFGIAAAQGREGIKEWLAIVAQEEGSRWPVDAYARLPVLAAQLQAVQTMIGSLRNGSLRSTARTRQVSGSRPSSVSGLSGPPRSQRSSRIGGFFDRAVILRRSVGSEGDRHGQRCAFSTKDNGMASPPVTLLALATAVPPNTLEQPAVADFARRIYAKSFARYPKLADVFVNAGIERRYSVRPIEWFEAPHDWTERTQAYLDGASALFVQAAKAALDRAGVSARDVDVIVTVSSTGIATPSLEARVGAEMGFKESATRASRLGVAMPVDDTVTITSTSRAETPARSSAALAACTNSALAPSKYACVRS